MGSRRAPALRGRIGPSQRQAHHQEPPRDAPGAVDRVEDAVDAESQARARMGMRQDRQGREALDEGAAVHRDAPGLLSANTMASRDCTRSCTRHARK